MNYLDTIYLEQTRRIYTLNTTPSDNIHQPPSESLLSSPSISSKRSGSGNRRVAATPDNRLSSKKTMI